MPKFSCTICTPTRELFSGEVSYVKIPGADGDFGVLPGHETFVCTNRPGIITLWLDDEGKEAIDFATYEGAAAVLNGELSILARMGRKVEDIDVEGVRAKREAMMQQIADFEKEEETSAVVAKIETSKARLDWYETQLKIKGETLNN